MLRFEAHDLIEDVRGRERRKRDAPGEQEDQVEDMIESIATDLESLLTWEQYQNYIEELENEDSDDDEYDEDLEDDDLFFDDEEE